MPDISTLPVEELDEATFRRCFHLVSRLRHAYEGSHFGWNPRAKKEEMKQPGMTYLLLKSNNQLLGFASYTIDKEPRLVYLYELHCSETGQGHGSLLLDSVKNRALELHCPVALTVFDVNDGARRFYQRHGFADESKVASTKRGYREMVWHSRQ